MVTAGLREAMCHMISEATVPSNTLIVLGQRPLDCSQISTACSYDALPMPRKFMRFVNVTRPGC